MGGKTLDGPSMALRCDGITAPALNWGTTADFLTLLFTTTVNSGWRWAA